MKNIVIYLLLIIPIGGNSTVTNDADTLSDEWIYCLAKFTEGQAENTLNNADIIVSNAYKACKTSGDALMKLDATENIKLALAQPDAPKDPVEQEALKQRITSEYRKVWKQDFDERMAPLLKCVVLYSRNGKNDYCEKLLTSGKYSSSQ